MLNIRRTTLRLPSDHSKLLVPTAALQLIPTESEKKGKRKIEKKDNWNFERAGSQMNQKNTLTFPTYILIKYILTPKDHKYALFIETFHTRDVKQSNKRDSRKESRGLFRFHTNGLWATSFQPWTDVLPLSSPSELPVRRDATWAKEKTLSTYADTLTEAPSSSASRTHAGTCIPNLLIRARFAAVE